MRELETDEKAVIIDLLAINHFRAHRSFLLHWNDFHLLARTPRAPGVHAKAVRAEVICVRPFVPLGSVL